MKEMLPKQTPIIPLVKEENQINWNEVLEKMRKTFGNDIYESWL